MMRAIRTFFAITAVLVAWTAAAQQITAELGAGFKAGFTCSAVFHAGRTLEQIKQDELAGADPGLNELPDPVIHHDTKSVTCAYAEDKPPRLAVFIDGWGTVLMPPGSSLDDANKLPHKSIEAPVPDGDPAMIAWPDGDFVENQPLSDNVDEAALNKAIDRAFDNETYAPCNTVGVVIVYKGDIIAERYKDGWGMHKQYRTWSTAKSITNALVGMMVGEGKLDVKQPAPILEWNMGHDPRSAITIENLLHMSSGLESQGADTLNAYWGGIDTAADAVASQLEVEPGTRWKYSNYDTLLLIASIKEVINDLETYMTLPRRALLNKIGMRHTFPETDPYGNFILSSQVYTTPRDLARFGLLYLNDGVWNGERILPEGWVEYTRTPAPANEQGRYGAQWWLYGVDERLPDDVYSTAGARGQHSTVVPSKDLVVVRTGIDPLRGGKWDQTQFTAEVIAAIK